MATISDNIRKVLLDNPYKIYRIPKSNPDSEGYALVFKGHTDAFTGKDIYAGYINSAANEAECIKDMKDYYTNTAIHEADDIDWVTVYDLP